MGIVGVKTPSIRESCQNIYTPVVGLQVGIADSSQQLIGNELPDYERSCVVEVGSVLEVRSVS